MHISQHTDQQSSETSYIMSCDTSHYTIQMLPYNLHIYFHSSQWGKEELLQQWSAQTSAGVMQLSLDAWWDKTIDLWYLSGTFIF